MKSFAIAAFAGAASAAWAPPAYGGASSESAASSAPSAEAYSSAAPSAEGYSAPPAQGYGSSSTAAPSAPVSAPGYGSSASSSFATYACNPAHSYPNGAQCVSTAGTLSLVTPSASATAPGGYGTGSAPAYTPKPTGGYGGSSANGTQGGYGGNGGDSYVTQIVTSYETYCPGPTTVYVSPTDSHNCSCALSARDPIRFLMC